MEVIMARSLKVSRVISFGKSGNTAQIVVSTKKGLKTRHIRLVNGVWKCKNGHIYSIEG